MNFSAERFAEAMAHLDPQPRSRGGREKRRAQRLSQRANLTIIPYTTDGAAAPRTVQLADFSTRGVRIIHTFEMSHGEEFVALIPRKNESPVPMLCTVVHTDKLGKEIYSSGAEFVCVAPTKVKNPNLPDNLERIKKSVLD